MTWESLTFIVEDDIYYDEVELAVVNDEGAHFIIEYMDDYYRVLFSTFPHDSGEYKTWESRKYLILTETCHTMKHGKDMCEILYNFVCNRDRDSLSKENIRRCYRRIRQTFTKDFDEED